MEGGREGGDICIQYGMRDVQHLEVQLRHFVGVERAGKGGDDPSAPVKQEEQRNGNFSNWVMFGVVAFF